MPNQKRIVLLHGWGTKREKLAPLAQELKKLGWQIFLPQLAGFDIPPPKNVWGTDDYAQDILKQAQKIFYKKKFFLFGHSFGGRIALKLGRDNKNLLGLILCSSSGLSRGNFLKRTVFLLLAKAGKILWILPPIAKMGKKLLYRLAGEHDYQKTQGVMREVFKKIISEDLRSLVEDIKLPVLILWGKKDRSTPVSDAYFLKQTLFRARLIVFPHQGHQLPYQEPKKIAQKIDRWARNL